MSQLNPVTCFEDADGNFPFYILLSCAADACAKGFIRYDAVQGPARRADLLELIRDMPHGERVRYAHKLKSQIWKHTCDYGDMRVRAASRRVLNFWCDLAGVSHEELD